MRIDITRLLDRPGATETVARTVDRADLTSEPGAWGPGDEALVGPIDLDLKLEMLVDGLLVTGTVAFPTVMPCARCLVDVRRAEESDVSEVFQDRRRLEDDEQDDLEPGYEVDHEGEIDLEALIRDAVLAAVPLRRLCKEDCAGLCARCGADLNVEDCGHRDEPTTDPRWAKLADLDLPPG